MIILKKYTKLAIFSIIFIIVSPIVVLYAKGDIFTDGWNILKTGGIYVTNAPVGSEIFINSKLKDSISFFQRSVLVKSLRPGNYEIFVKKKGYNSWTNEIKVYANIVSEVNVFMLPTELELKEITKYNLTEDATGSVVSTQVKNKEYEDIRLFFSKNSGEVAKQDLPTSAINLKSNLGTKESPIIKGKLRLWQENGEIFVAWFGKHDTAPKYFCRESDCTQTVSMFNFGKQLRRINFLPEYDDVIIVALDNKIEAFQMDSYLKKVFQDIYVGKNPDFLIIDGTLYVKDGDFIAKVVF